MRDQDRMETLASEGMDAERVLRRNIKGSTYARTVFIRGEAVAMFGVVGMPADRNVVWMLSTRSADRYPRRFWAASKMILGKIRKHYPSLVAMIDSRYSRALTWARHLGFEIGEAQPFGAEQLPFHTVVLKGA